jgi:hypothetical protein
MMFWLVYSLYKHKFFNHFRTLSHGEITVTPHVNEISLSEFRNPFLVEFDMFSMLTAVSNHCYGLTLRTVTATLARTGKKSVDFFVITLRFITCA